MNAIGARQLYALPHQRRGYRERRAWGQHDTEHGVPVRVVIALDHAPGIAQDGLFLLYNLVRGQSTLRFPDRHGAAGGMKPRAHLYSRLYLVVQPGPMRPDVRVIARSRASGE